MAKIDMGEIVRSLERKLKPMLLEFISDVAPDAKIADKDKMFKRFKERIDSEFKSAADVPDELVQVEAKN